VGLLEKNLSPKGDALQAQTALLLMIMNNDDDVHGGGKVVTFGAISGNGARWRVEVLPHL